MKSSKSRKETMKQLIVVVSIVILVSVIFFYGVGTNPASWFMPADKIILTDTTIDFYIGLSGNSWRADLSDSTGKVIQSVSGASYGTHSFTRPDIEGTYTLKIWCFYGSSACTERNTETIFVPAKAVVTPAPTPTPTITPDVTSLEPRQTELQVLNPAETTAAPTPTPAAEIIQTQPGVQRTTISPPPPPVSNQPTGMSENTQLAIVAGIILVIIILVIRLTGRKK